MTILARIASLALLMSVAAPASAQMETVKIRVASHLPQASEVSERYLATCDKIGYTLVNDRKLGSVTLLSPGMADVNLSHTRAGAALLDPRFFGHVSFNCPKGAINVFVGGVDVRAGKAVGVRYIASVRRSGEIDGTGPIDVSLDDFYDMLR